MRATVEPTGKPLLYKGFWSLLMKRISREPPSWSRATRPPTASGLSLPTGISDALYTVYFTRRGLFSELYFEAADSELNTVRYETLLAVREVLEDDYGGAVKWQPMPGRKASRIAEFLPGAEVGREQDWPMNLDWLLDLQNRLRHALNVAGGIARA